jgi:hypothetical protein
MNALPSSLLERLRPAALLTRVLPPPRAGAHVLYCLRTAHRSVANPALETALIMATSLKLPLICLAVVEDNLPKGRAFHSTDRNAAFRLEALKELQPLFEQRGTALYVHVERDGCRPAVALSLSAKAALVIIDEHFGIEPHAAAATRVAATGVPCWLSDTVCTVPAVTIGAAALNGGNAAYLRATAKARATRLANISWLPPAPAPQHPPPAEPPSWNVNLTIEGALDAVLRAPSRRDASVARVRHTIGGPEAASARWSSYIKGGGLKTYAGNRNNPLAPDGKGASRMSAYTNQGMIDPYLLARDAKAAGSDKFFDEFCGFRESSYLWCLLHPGEYANAAVAVPSWARGQLKAAADRAAIDGGANDARTPDLASLEAGRSGDAYWDDCQRSLFIAGELHNNVRMAWGKAIPAWHAVLTTTAGGGNVATPAVRLQAALDLLIRLNDKFALDGGAPPSYGGLLWCLGWRDRPGSNGCPKSRPTSVMATRIRPGDLEARAKRLCTQQAPLFSGSTTASPYEIARAQAAAKASYSTSASLAPTPRDNDGAQDERREWRGPSPPSKRPRGPGTPSSSSSSKGGGALMNWLSQAK